MRSFADALAGKPKLHLIVVLPLHPDQDGSISEPLNLVGRQAALDRVRQAGGSRVGVYGIENHAAVPVYVHAKVGIVDDVWASVGSDNINRRSWTHDSELACAVIDDARDQRDPTSLDGLGAGARRFARELRLRLAAEHLDRTDGSVDDFCDPLTAFDAFAASASALQHWHDAGRRGARPAGRLRPYTTPRLSRTTLAWATPLYRAICDPDGRPRPLRKAQSFDRVNRARPHLRTGVTVDRAIYAGLSVTTFSFIAGRSKQGQSQQQQQTLTARVMKHDNGRWLVAFSAQR